jgi:tetratricopeptide (TPR) repeat protein
MKSRDDASDGQLDEFDFAILDGIRVLFEQADPMPADLPERVRFALAMRGLETEVARLVTEEDPRLAAARGTEQSRTVTFDSASLSIIIRIEANKNGSVRIDGWLAPPQRRQIELQTSAQTLSVASDEQGRFAFGEVPAGTARLVVTAAERDQSGRAPTVVTPALVLLPMADVHADRTVRRAWEAHRRGVQAGAAGRPVLGARRLRAGLLLLGWEESGDQLVVQEAFRPVAARLLISLAHLEAEQGRTEYGLRLLDQAQGLTAPADRGILLSQRGLLLMRMWRIGEALRFFDAAVSLLDGYADVRVLARVLLNRGVLHLNVGSVQRARADFAWCQRIAAAGQHDSLAAKAAHNLGCCDLLAGDIPAALKVFAAAEDGFRLTASTSSQWLPVLTTDKARALLAVGLSSDAIAELDGAIAAFRRLRLDHDLAQAELTLAQAALAAGALTSARHWAVAARRRFRRQGNAACAYLTELILLRSRFATPGCRPGPIAAEAEQLAGRLRGGGLRSDADLAELLAARALVAAGRGAQARRRIAATRHRGPIASLEVGLLRQLAKAELAELEKRPAAMLRELRAGLALLRARRSRLGSVDLQTGAAALGADLAAAGLRQALDRGSAPLVFAWLERSRAQAFRARPVRPPADARTAEIVAELRQLGYLIRGAELSGTRDPAAIARRARLQREVREVSWQAIGRGEAVGRVGLAEISAALCASEQRLVSLLARDGRLHAVVLTGKAVRLIRLGDFGAAAEAALRLGADLDTLAGGRRPARLEAVIKDSIHRQTEVLTAEVVAPMRRLLGDAGLVIVPTGPLASVPWNMITELRGRPVTVCPSASSWLTAWRRRPTLGASLGAPPGVSPAQPPPLLVAGPDLAHASAEAAAIAKIYPGSRLLLAESATVSGTLAGLDGTPLAHLAAHGHDERENFLFSRLDLADGPLMAYDVQQLATPPGQVILSACDVGRSVARPGEELLGFTAALLYIGTATVVSSIARVADDAAVGVMTAYHQRLTAGARPAQALAEAAVAAAEPFSPFVCFGSG